LRGGAKVESVGEPDGAHPLHLAVMKNDVAISILLIKYGARPESRDAKGRTPLMVAAESGSARALSVLLANGANVESYNPTNGETALGYAVMANRIECAKALIEEGDRDSIDLADQLVRMMSEKLDTVEGDSRKKKILDFHATLLAEAAQLIPQHGNDAEKREHKAPYEFGSRTFPSATLVVAYY